MPKKTVTTVICAVMLISLCGCASLFGSNSRADTCYLSPTETDAAYSYIIPYVYGATVITANKETGAVTVEKDENVADYPYAEYPTVLRGSNAPRYSDYCGEGYEILPSLIVEKYESKGVKLVQYYGVECGEKGVCRGFINLYTRTSGYLSGGGQIDAKRIVAGIIFTYDSLSGEFAELYRLDKCNIVAFDFSHAIYFRSRKYYVRDFSADTEKYLFEDEAYDTGMTGYSYARFYFNERHFIAAMHHGELSEKNDYDRIIVTDFDGNILAKQKITA